jgi:nucleotide-binding universal stress UspA family protein
MPADQLDATLIVLGSRGPTRIGSMLLGNIAHNAVHA